MTQLFNISIRLGKLPEEWKIPCVTSIPKSYNKSVPENYPEAVSSLRLSVGIHSSKSITGALLDATDQWHRQLDLGL